MKAEFYLGQPVNIDNKVIPAGTKIATIETADDVPVERAISAIVKGLATQNAPVIPASTPAPAPGPQKA